MNVNSLPKLNVDHRIFTPLNLSQSEEEEDVDSEPTAIKRPAAGQAGAQTTLNMDKSGKLELVLQKPKQTK